MNIGLHIAEILDERGKVSVQGVGTFYLKKTEAFFDEQRQIFFPTDEKLSFKLFEEDNSIFPVYVSKAEGIDIDTANQLIKKFAVKFSTELGTTGTTEIRGIGKLKKSGSEYTIETFSSYGLMPLPEAGYESPGTRDFSNDDVIIEEIIDKKENIVEEEPIEDEMPPVQEEPVLRHQAAEEDIKENIKESTAEESIRTEEPEAKEEPVKEQDPERQRTPPPDREVEREDTNFQGNYGNLFDGAIAGSVSRDDLDGVEEKNGSSLMKWLIIIAALLLILVPAGYYFSPQIKELIKKRQTAGSVVPAPVAPLPVAPAPVDSLADSAKITQSDSIKAAASPVIKPDSAAAGTITYEIIIASFSRKDEAETYISQMAAKGQKVHLLERPSRTFKYKVSAGSFKDQAAAQNALSLVRKNINKEAWVDQIKN